MYTARKEKDLGPLALGSTRLERRVGKGVEREKDRKEERARELQNEEARLERLGSSHGHKNADIRL